MNKILLSIKEASEMCGIDDKKISDEIKSGRLKVFRLPGMVHPKIPIQELQKWIEINSYYLTNKGINYETKAN
jgi:excisionase family DNA binding protein